MRTRYPAAAALALLACVVAAQTAPSGYLAGHEPDVLAALAPSPAPGSPRDVSDRAAFRATRALKGSPRWAAATSDARLSLRDLYADFSCAAGVRLDPARTPRLNAVLARAAPDVAAAFDPVKEHYRRLRPYLVERGQTCVPRTADLDRNYDYPSGHAAFGWTVGLILAQAIPDRAGPIMGRARVFGDSRVVCGVHTPSAVEAGRYAADTVVAALEANDAFRSDLAAARAELAGLRAAGATPGACPAPSAEAPW